MSTTSSYVDPATLRQLSVLSPAVTAFAIASDWLVIFAAIAVSEWVDNWLVYLASIIVIAGRMHALGVLVHDFAHYRFIASKRLSEWIGDLFLAWPILITVDGYRTTHLAHHNHTNTDNDPDFVARDGTAPFSFPATPTALFAQLLGYVLVWRTVADIMDYHTRKIAKDTKSIYVITRLSYYVVILLLLWYFGVFYEFLLYWVIPFTTIFFMLMYVRAVAEHFCDMDYSSIETGTRTVIPLAWERPFFAPHNVNYHVEHHIYPSVPFYRLPQLHRHMMMDRDYISKAHVTRGYTTGLLRECFGFGARMRAQFQTSQAAKPF